MYTLKICHCGWPIAGQNKVKWENQIENTGKKRGGVKSHQPNAEGSGMCHTKKGTNM